MSERLNLSAGVAAVKPCPVFNSLCERNVWFRPAVNPVNHRLGLDAGRTASEEDVVDILTNCTADGDLPYACAAIFVSTEKSGEILTYAQHVDDEQIDCDDAGDAFIGWLIYRPSVLFDTAKQVLDPLQIWLRENASFTPEELRLSSYRSVTGHAWKPIAIVDKAEAASCRRTITAYDAVDLIDMLAQARGAVGRDIVHGQMNEDSSIDMTDNVLATVEYRVIRRWLSQFFPDRFQGEHPDEGEGYPDDDDWLDEYADCGFARQAA